jgi:hypothetical protein
VPNFPITRRNEPVRLSSLWIDQINCGIALLMSHWTTAIRRVLDRILPMCTDAVTCRPLQGYLAACRLVADRCPCATVLSSLCSAIRIYPMSITLGFPGRAIDTSALERINRDLVSKVAKYSR